MKLSCLVITTNISNRLHLLRDAVDSIDKADSGQIQQRVLSVDIFKDAGGTLPYREYYEKRNWIIVQGECSGHRGMVNNIQRGLKSISEEILLYSEDDIRVDRIPSSDVINQLFSKVIRGRRVGLICYNTYMYEAPRTRDINRRIDYLNDRSNYFVLGEDDLFLVKDEWFRDEYYINFPVALARTDLFRSMVTFALKNYHRKGMEVAMSDAWYDLGYDKQYVILMFLNKNVVETPYIDQQELYKGTRMRFYHNDIRLRHPSINKRKNTIL